MGKWLECGSSKDLFIELEVIKIFGAFIYIVEL